jgi:hypothetical protein
VTAIANKWANIVAGVAEIWKLRLLGGIVQLDDLESITLAQRDRDNWKGGDQWELEIGVV